MTKNTLTLSQLEQYLAKAAWILKGPVDASDFKVYIFPLLFFKGISDVYDEEYQTALKESEEICFLTGVSPVYIAGRLPLAKCTRNNR